MMGLEFRVVQVMVAAECGDDEVPEGCQDGYDEAVARGYVGPLGLTAAGRRRLANFRAGLFPYDG